MRKIISLILVIVSVITSAGVMPCYAVDLSADIPGVDYSRLSWDSSLGNYTATATVGSFTFQGELKRDGKLTREELNAIIYEIFEMNGIDSSDLVYANKLIDAAKQDGIITGEDYLHIVGNIASILGYDVQLNAALDLGSAIMGKTGERQDQVMEQLQKTGVFDYNQYNALKYSMQNLGTVQGFMEFAASMSADLYQKLRDSDIVRYGITDAADANPVLKAIAVTYNLLKVCYEEHKRDVARWDRRVKALNACYFMRSFYDAVEELCQHRYAEHGQWVLSINGRGARKFSFLNSSGNVQYLDFNCNMVKDNTGYKFDDAKPSGNYYGRISMTLTHDMTPFDILFWNNQCGKLKKNWYSQCMAVPFYECSSSGSTTITRTLKTLSTKFTIYSSDYTKSLTTRGNVERSQKWKLTSFFTDDIEINCTQQASVVCSGAFDQEGAGIVATTEGNMFVHAENGPGYINIVLDSASGAVNLLGGELASTTVGTQTVGRLWDSNIWESVRYGVKISVYM